MITEIIQKSFDLRNQSHARHWTTDSYSEHQALGDFYDGLIDLLDKYVESYIGTFGKNEAIPDDNTKITDAIREQLVWLNENRSEISNGIPALENILDEMAGLYMSTLFKLENLR